MGLLKQGMVLLLVGFTSFSLDYVEFLDNNSLSLHFWGNEGGIRREVIFGVANI